MNDSVLMCATGHECDGTEPCADLCQRRTDADDR